jgi:hypothetical protein
LWVFTTKGFFSIVEHKKDPNRVVIRARVRKDIEKVKMLFEECRVDWAGVMTQLITDLGYTNFKNAVYETDSLEIRDKRHEAYLDIWAIMHELQFREG